MPAGLTLWTRVCCMKPFVNKDSGLIVVAARPLLDNVLSSISKPSVSAGVGLVYKLDPVRVEVNFGVPLVASKSDGVRKGFQVGIGLDFL